MKTKLISLQMIKGKYDLNSDDIKYRLKIKSEGKINSFIVDYTFILNMRDEIKKLIYWNDYKKGGNFL